MKVSDLIRLANEYIEQHGDNTVSVQYSYRTNDEYETKITSVDEIETAEFNKFKFLLVTEFANSDEDE